MVPYKLGTIIEFSQPINFEYFLNVSSANRHVTALNLLEFQFSMVRQMCVAKLQRLKLVKLLFF